MLAKICHTHDFELITRASAVRVLACDIQRTLQNIHAVDSIVMYSQSCVGQASEMDITYRPDRDASATT